MRILQMTVEITNYRFREGAYFMLTNNSLEAVLNAITSI